LETSDITRPENKHEVKYTVKPRFNVPAFSEIPDLVMIFSCPDNSSILTNKPTFNENLDLLKYVYSNPPAIQ
jgi:hypothetical protein